MTRILFASLGLLLGAVLALPKHGYPRVAYCETQTWKTLRPDDVGSHSYVGSLAVEPIDDGVLRPVWRLAAMYGHGRRTPGKWIRWVTLPDGPVPDLEIHPSGEADRVSFYEWTHSCALIGPCPHSPQHRAVQRQLICTPEPAWTRFAPALGRVLRPLYDLVEPR